jgi:hypothetical protein
MLNIYKKISILALGVFFQNAMSGQCASPVNLGTASNMFTLIRNGNNPVAVNKSLNTIAFIHRNNASAFGGSSGQLRYDLSTNSGTTWSLNLGVLNPLTPELARYPNLAIYNPTTNTNPMNQYVSYLAPTIASATSAWNGVVSGVSQVNGTGVTESYNQNGMGTNQIPHSLVNGAPGVFWATEPFYSSSTGFYIYKGIWNSSINDIVWNVNYTVTPSFVTTYFGDYNIGFDPTGMIGYFSFLGHVSGGSTNAALNPVLYKTTDGGTTWTGPIQVDMSKFSCISSNTTSPYVPSTNIEHDLVVDMYGNPHIITTVGSASSYNFNYSAWHHMYDITLKNGVWAAYDLGNVNGGAYTAGISPNFATHWQAPQAARTADGSKVFFTWTDNSSYSLGTANSTPDLMGKAFNVVAGTWTQSKNFTSCSGAAAGKIFYPHLAPEVLEPSTNVYKLAPVYGENSVTNDLGQVANFKFLDNVTFSASEFSVATPAATVTIPQGPNVLLCPSSSVIINVANAGQALWSNSVTTTTLAITSSTVTSYSVVAQVGCLVGTASITVSNLTVNASAVTSSVCPGSPATFSVAGNALGYTWTPGNVTGTNVILNPSTSPVTLTALGGGSCTTTQTVGIGILPLPTIVVAGNLTTCAGYNETYTASGAATYVWSDGSTSFTTALSATQNTMYTVTGTAANSCTNTTTVNITVKPSPTITASSSQTAICAGGTVGLVAFGASSYSWNPGMGTNSTMTTTPASTTIYTVTGIGSNACAADGTIQIVVNALPTLTVTLSKPMICAGEKGTLTVSGASNYTWTNPASTSSTILITPTANTTYTVIGKNAQGCVTTHTYSQAVNPCTGINELEKGNLLVYPNPNNGSFNITCAEEMTIEIINEIGQLIKISEVNAGGNITINDLPSGIYFVTGTSNHETLRYKVIIQK